jgi:hypothetical protein
MTSGKQMRRPNSRNGVAIADCPMQRHNNVHEFERTPYISREPAPGLEPGTDGYKVCFSVTLIIFLFFLFVLVPCLGATNVGTDVAKLCLGLDAFSNNIAVIE